jgi:hypothetical protein
MDQARPHVTQRRHTHDDRALLDWPTCSSSDPIRWRPSADPGQKQDTGDRIMAQGIDQAGPVTEDTGDRIMAQGIDQAGPVTEV